MKNTLFILGGAFVLLVGGFFALNSYVYNEKQRDKVLEKTVSDYKNLTFYVAGEAITLADGISKIPVAKDSASMITTQYFGNEAMGDIDGDGDEDVVFLVTQDGGGSGIFFYLVGAIQEESGYRGTQAVLIGDRIAPQTTEFRDGQVIVNYTDRAPGEAMATRPSIGKSLYLKYDPILMQFGEVVQDFEGETGNTGILPFKSGVTGSVLLGPVCPVETYPPDPNCAPRPLETTVRVFVKNTTQPFAVTSSDDNGTFTFALPPGEYTVKADGGNPLPRCESTDITVVSDTMSEITVSCDTGIR